MKTTNELDAFIKLLMQFSKMVEVFEKLSKSFPNDPVNDLKLEFVNDLMKNATELISRNNKPFNEFEMFGSDHRPSNSDVFLVLAQYQACLKKYGSDQTRVLESKAYWVINNRRTIIEADMNLFK